jgi:hypothetical protein
MKKRFNIAGNCFKKEHYMMDDSRRFKAILELVEYGDYFVINRPRQYGKTTMLLALENFLPQQGYLIISMNFQGIDEQATTSDDAFATMFLHQLHRAFKYSNKELAAFVSENSEPIMTMDKLSDFITLFMYKVQTKVVLLIDEVDASSNYNPFLSLLAMLRTKYLNRNSPEHRTFHSIVLAGVHDIKSLKFKLRNPEDTQTNSPWNIAVDFKVVMEFYPNEIAYMLRQYSEAEGVTMDFEAISERLYYHTSGYPFLISKLCKNIAEDILPTKQDKTVWTLDDVEASVRLLLKERNTNFDSILKNIENNSALKDFVSAILLDGNNVPFNINEPITQLGQTYGIFKDEGTIKIHNRVYEQLIYNYLSAVRLQQMISEKTYNFGDNYLTDDGNLDLETVLRKFQTFMKEQRSKKDLHFLEREWRLVFLSFLKPILNGKGHDFKEVETSEEKRLDVVVTYLQYKYILELKLWRGLKAHDKGLKQLVDYLDIHGVNKGYLLIFDTRKKLTWETKMIKQDGKEIFAVWL